MQYSESGGRCAGQVWMEGETQACWVEVVQDRKGLAEVGLFEQDLEVKWVFGR